MKRPGIPQTRPKRFIILKDLHNLPSVTQKCTLSAPKSIQICIFREKKMHSNYVSKLLCRVVLSDISPVMHPDAPVAPRSAMAEIYRYYLIALPMLYVCYPIHPSPDLLKRPVQIQRTHRNPAAVHGIGVVWLHCLVRPGIEQQAGNAVRLVAKGILPVLHIGEDLVEVA